MNEFQKEPKVKSVARAGEIVQYLQLHGPKGLSTIAEELELASSTAHNYLQTLELMGYIVKENDRYRLGLRFLTHGTTAKNSLQSKELIIEQMQIVAEQLEHPVWWVCEETGRGIFVHKEGNSLQDLYGVVGKRSHLHVHAPGQAILAKLDEDERDAIIGTHGLPAETNQTITDRAELAERVAATRSDGFALSDGEAVLGVSSVGVGLRVPTGRTHGLGTFHMSRELSSQRIDRISDELLRAAETITEQMEERK